MTHTHPHVHDDYLSDEEPSFALGHLRRYADVILLSTLAVAIAYAIISVLVYLLAPSQRVTTQTFRLEFNGASGGQYPNGIKFNPTEIVAVPTLAKTYAANELSRYMTFDTFSRSVFMLEANPQYEQLVADYRARMADPRLTPVDRDRMQREFDTKRESIAKNTYSINFARANGATGVPETLVRKSISDVLSSWAQHAVNDQHVLDYRLSILTPQVLDANPLESGDYIMAIQVLRSKLNRELDNIRNLSRVPAAELVRSRDGLSLQEIQLRIEDLKRFRLEPLVPLVYSGGLMKDREATIRFLETQLAYDQRQLRGQQLEADQIRQAFAVYALDQRALMTTTQTPQRTPTSSAATPPAKEAMPGGGTESVMPQLSDSFLDRLVSLTGRSQDVVYRQSVADDFRSASARIIPAQQAVDYDQEILQQIKSAPAGGPRRDPAVIGAEIEAVRAEARSLIAKVNEIYKSMSRNLNPSTELYSVTAPPLTRIERSASLTQLALYGVLFVLAALVIVSILCLIHDRFGREDEAEVELAEAAPPASHAV
jgi:hypothetical protein